MKKNREKKVSQLVLKKNGRLIISTENKKIVQIILEDESTG